MDDVQRKHLNIILREMSNRIDVDWETIDTTNSDWFLQYSWDKKTEEDFTDWLTNYLLATRGAYKSLAAYKLRPTKKRCRSIADQFVLNYGWGVR